MSDAAGHLHEASSVGLLSALVGARPGMAGAEGQLAMFWSEPASD
jgi:hypothetical protein